MSYSGIFTKKAGDVPVPERTLGGEPVIFGKLSNTLSEAVELLHGNNISRSGAGPWSPLEPASSTTESVSSLNVPRLVLYSLPIVDDSEEAKEQPFQFRFVGVLDYESIVYYTIKHFRDAASPDSSYADWFLSSKFASHTLKDFVDGGKL